MTEWKRGKEENKQIINIKQYKEKNEKQKLKLDK